MESILYFLEILDDIQSHQIGTFLHTFWIKMYHLNYKNLKYKTSADLVFKYDFFCSKNVDTLQHIYEVRLIYNIVSVFS